MEKLKISLLIKVKTDIRDVLKEHQQNVNYGNVYVVDMDLKTRSWKLNMPKIKVKMKS